jgi:hypothetical protein
MGETIYRINGTIVAGIQVSLGAIPRQSIYRGALN